MPGQSDDTGDDRNEELDPTGERADGAPAVIEGGLAPVFSVSPPEPGAA